MFSTLIVERNVIYLVPIVFAATAAVLERPIATAPALASRLRCRTGPHLERRFRLDQYPYFEAPSLAIGALANRNFVWDAAHVERALVVVALVSVALLAAHSFVRSRTVGLAIAVIAACAVTTWALTTEIYASRGLNIFSERMHQISPKPVDWVDQATGGEPTLFLGQQIGKDTNPIWLLEFWNYSIDKIWSLDGTAPLPSLSPDLGEPDGTTQPRSRSALGRDRERRRGPRREGRRAARRDAALARPAAGPLPEHPDRRLPGRLDELERTFSQYAPEDGVSRGFSKVVVSRQGACGAHPDGRRHRPGRPASPCVNKQPGFARVDEVVRRKLPACGLTQVVTRANVPYHVEVTVKPTFIPAEIDASSGDVRELGAQVGFDFIPLGEAGG